MKDRLTRTELLAAAGAAGVGLGLASLRPWSALVEVEAALPATRLRQLLSSSESARAIGRAYIEVEPGERSEAVLVDRIAGALHGGRSALEAQRGELRRLVAEAIRDDFDGGRLVNVDGWLLARVEARLYALAALR